MKKQTTPVFTVAEARHYFLFEMEHDNLEEPEFLSDTTLMKYKDCEVANKYLKKLHIRMQYAIALKRHYDRQFINVFRKPLIYLKSDNTELLELRTPVVLLCWDRMDPDKPLPRADQDVVVRCVLLTRDMAMEALCRARKIELKRLNSPFHRIIQKITHKLTRIYNDNNQ
jgi:hypothetical protein